ncbi:hypothetical protein BSKO_03070 [Bryopsis sp. KO-2023]|nr:hypothetical protein BSKO_03070 [Bryopsis sp. KO-2023]
MTRSTLSKVSMVLGKIRQPSSNTSRKLVCLTDLPSDDSRDPLPGPPAKLWQWFGLVKTLLAPKDKYRWDLITWSESEGEESEIYWSELSTPTTGDAFLPVVTVRGKKIEDPGLITPENGSSGVGFRPVAVNKSSAVSGIHDATGLGQKLWKKCQGLRTSFRKRGNHFCAVRASTENGGEFNQRRTLRKKVDKWMAGARTSVSKKSDGESRRVGKHHCNDLFQNTSGIVTPPPQQKPKVSDRTRGNVEMVLQKIAVRWWTKE